MKTKSKILLPLGALTLSLALVACGTTAPAKTTAAETTTAVTETEVTLVTQDENPGLAFAGSYDDTWSMRAHMDITYNEEKGNFTVQLMHGDSAEVSYEWMGDAVFDAAARAFVCAEMTEYRLTAAEGGEITAEEVAHYTDITLPIDEEGAISVPKLNTNYRFMLPTDGAEE